MTVIALTTFVEVRDTNEKVKHRYQNSKPGEVILFNGAYYSYLSFAYQGAAKSRAGDNLEAQLVMSVNWLSQGVAAEAVRNKWRTRIDTCVMKNNHTEVARILTTDHWLVASMGYDTTTVELVLSSAIDAVGSNAPTRVLTPQKVGALPVTASISNR